jgi:hypothetical protein
MRGAITLSVRRRTYSESKRYKDKWQMVDTVFLKSIPPREYQTFSKKTGRSYRITKDELAFVRFIITSYGPGDFSILVFGKGKNKGFRRFWDGLITPDGKFLRRRETHHIAEGESSLFARQSNFTVFTESFIGKFMKTKRPGIWYPM